MSWARRFAAGTRGDAAGTIACVMRRLQSIPYRADPPGSDPILPVREVLLGCSACDCEDRTAAVVAALRLLGYVAWPVYIEQPRAPQDHVTARVMVGGRVLWCDTTVAAELGEHPFTAAERLGMGHVQ